MRVLSLDVGSSSLKFALVDQIEDEGNIARSGEVVLKDGWESALDEIWAIVSHESTPLEAIGHRIVMSPPECDGPTRLTDALVAALERLRHRDPIHLDAQIAILRAAAKRYPAVPQVLCFDTTFFRDLPETAKRIALPSTIPSYIHRYGFHGLSYESVLRTLGDPKGRVVIAHLGSGASLCAIRDGMPMETTLGFGVLGGLVMRTRPGDVDPSVLLELLESGYGVRELSTMLYEESGLRGVSGRSGDMRELLELEATDERAAAAVALFVHVLRKHVGAMIAAIGGIDVLVFTGGIGERAPAIRARACEPFSFLGLAIDGAANGRNEPVVSSARSSVTVRVVASNENAAIARHVWSALR